MKRHAIPRVLTVVSCFVLVALLGLPLLQVAPASASTVPQVTVFLKNLKAEYNLATGEFLAAQFDDLDSPAYGQVSYIVVTELTQGALAGSAALIIDESADMSLSAGEALLIHNFVGQGGKVGLFTFPRFYWSTVAANPGAFQVIADVFGNATVGEPNAGEVTSGNSSARVTDYDCVQDLCFTEPYSVTGALVTTYDDTPFTPITSTGTHAVLTSGALGGAPVAVANSNGLLVTNSLGDLVQGSDANLAYRQFVVDAIVWLAKTGSVQSHIQYLPLVTRN